MKSKFHSSNTVQKARKLRKEGLSSSEIARRLGVGDTTVLRWCNDITSQNPYHLYAKKMRMRAKGKSIGLVEKIKIGKDMAKLLASILYWCEGAKYPSTNFIAFSNSDIDLIRTFLKLFRFGFQPQEDRIKVHLQIHTTHNIEATISFWSRITKIPKAQFYKPTITKPTKNMKRKNYKGTCTIRYYDVYLLHEIIGIYEEFSKIS
jgi:transcriptional regulator with XRE-family HTH domain